MPGNCNWKTLYIEEFSQLFEEGYSVGDNPKPDMRSKYLPFPTSERGRPTEEHLSEEMCEQAYWNLW